MDASLLLNRKPKPDTTVKIHPLIQNRWSPRAFSPKPIPHEAVMALFEAARWAPSSYNEQPWRFIYATAGHPSFAKICGAMLGNNA